MNKGTTIFIDTEDMEERYGEELYKEYLEKENKQLEHNWNELKSWLLKKMNEYVTYQGDLSSIYEEVFDKAVELEEGGNND